MQTEDWVAFADLVNTFLQNLGLRDTDADVKAAKKATLQEKSLLLAACVCVCVYLYVHTYI